jgi:catechol 2,3-dioxygenase-like lactoylglutathione lyase family enzyme
MKFVPLFKVSNIQKAINFYTNILDFELTDPKDSIESSVVDLGHNGVLEIQITTHESEILFGSVVNVWVENVDLLFEKYKNRGLVGKSESQVHQSPIDQTWGRREFYATDSDGNTLRFMQNI